ncbi:MAG: hypothetical protein QOJ39_325 [Candidatus Eremiobacteraeota bacterium]|nr:hypothetical protein [Candidatus Eremiobacteraeota bacterium]
MLTEGRLHGVIEGGEYDLHTFATRYLHGWYDVSVARDDDDPVDQPILRHDSYIEPNTEIDPFLAKHGLKIVCDNRTTAIENLRGCLVGQGPSVK